MTASTVCSTVDYTQDNRPPRTNFRADFVGNGESANAERCVFYGKVSTTSLQSHHSGRVWRKSARKFVRGCAILRVIHGTTAGVVVVQQLTNERTSSALPTHNRLWPTKKYRQKYVRHVQRISYTTYDTYNVPVIRRTAVRIYRSTYQIENNGFRTEH